LMFMNFKVHSCLLFPPIVNLHPLGMCGDFLYCQAPLSVRSPYLFNFFDRTNTNIFEADYHRRLWKRQRRKIIVNTY
jgi:hypothetical protein